MRPAHSLAARISLVPTAPLCSALCAARAVSHRVTAQHPPRSGAQNKLPGRRRIASSSAARPSLAPDCHDAQHARRYVVGEGKSLRDRPFPTPMWQTMFSARLTAERVQPDCLHPPSALCLFVGHSTR